MCPTRRHRRLPQRPGRNNRIPCELRSAVDSDKEFYLATSIAAVCCYREAIVVSPSWYRGIAFCGSTDSDCIVYQRVLLAFSPGPQPVQAN